MDVRLYSEIFIFILCMVIVLAIVDESLVRSVTAMFCRIHKICISHLVR